MGRAKLVAMRDEIVQGTAEVEKSGSGPSSAGDLAREGPSGRAGTATIPGRALSLKSSQ
jgi:hypothetical protein